MVVSPDIGGVKMVSAYANMFHAPLAIVAKKRKSASEVEVLNVVGEVKGHDVLLVDDLTETAGTLTRAAEVLKQKGAKRVFAAVSHAVLNAAALDRLKKSQLEELVTTDTVPHSKVSGFKLTELTVAPLLGEAIKRIHNSESVSSLFEINGARPEKLGEGRSDFQERGKSKSKLRRLRLEENIRMAKQVQLKAKSRVETGKGPVKRLRAAGVVPAVVYGARTKPLNIAIEFEELDKVLHHATGENVLVDLLVEENGKTNNRLALIQEVQHHPFEDVDPAR